MQVGTRPRLKPSLTEEQTNKQRRKKKTTTTLKEQHIIQQKTKNNQWVKKQKTKVSTNTLDAFMFDNLLTSMNNTTIDRSSFWAWTVKRPKLNQLDMSKSDPQSLFVLFCFVLVCFGLCWFVFVGEYVSLLAMTLLSVLFVCCQPCFLFVSPLLYFCVLYFYFVLQWFKQQVCWLQFSSIQQQDLVTSSGGTHCQMNTSHVQNRTLLAIFWIHCLYVPLTEPIKGNACKQLAKFPANNPRITEVWEYSEYICSPKETGKSASILPVFLVNDEFTRYGLHCMCQLQLVLVCYQKNQQISTSAWQKTSRSIYGWMCAKDPQRTEAR